MPRACLQTDRFNHVIRAVNLTSGAVTTIAGQSGVSAPFTEGIGTAATFFQPLGIQLGLDTTAFVVGFDITLVITCALLQ
jgi:hypothetical protein